MYLMFKSEVLHHREHLAKHIGYLCNKRYCQLMCQCEDYEGLDKRTYKFEPPHEVVT